MGYGLQIFSVFVANGNFGISYIFVTVLVCVSSIFPFILKKQDQKKEAEKAELQKNESDSKDEIGQTAPSTLHENEKGKEVGQLVSSTASTVAKDPAYAEFLEVLNSE